jgi:hypothetical protein
LTCVIGAQLQDSPILEKFEGREIMIGYVSVGTNDITKAG